MPCSPIQYVLTAPVVENEGRPGLVIAPGLLDEADIDRVYAELGDTPMLKGTTSDQAISDQERNSDIAWLHEPKWTWLLDKLRDVAFLINEQNWQFPLDLSHSQGIQFTRYRTGQYYDWHPDWSDDNPGSDTNRRRISVSVLLRNPIKGGGLETETHGLIDLQPGDAAFFPSCEKHRALVVEEGVRDVLVAWYLCPVNEHTDFFNNVDIMVSPEIDPVTFDVTDNLLPDNQRAGLADSLSGIGEVLGGYVENTLSAYNPPGSADVLLRFKPKVEELVGHEVYPVCTFLRHYGRGAILRDHKDRPELDWTVSLSLDSDKDWSMECLLADDTWGSYATTKSKALLVNGNRVQHQRMTPYAGERCTVLLLHYANAPSAEWQPTQG